MNLIDTIQNDLIDAMKNKNTQKVSVLRMLKTAILNKQIAKQDDLISDEMIQIIQSEIKQATESLEAFKNAGKSILEFENSIGILKKYLPDQLSENEITQIIGRAINKIDAKSIEQMGLVMKEIMPRLVGKADGAKVSEIVKAKLNGRDN